jgi:hypothetical protein
VRDDDELLRQMFEREARLVPYTTDAHAALASIEPALRCAALKRASLIAASAVLVIGGGAAAVSAVRVPDADVSVGARPTPTETVPAITSAPVTVPVITGTAADGTDAATTDSTPRRSPSHVVEHDTDTAARPTVGPTPTEPGSTVPATVRSVSPAPQITAPPQPSPTTAATTTTTTTTPSSSPVVYDTECGVIVAELSTTPPTLLEITPREGYEVHVEDPDRGRITVHLAGRDHDCEIHVGAAANEDSHESPTASDEPPDG